MTARNMAPTNAQISHQLRQTIYYHLDNGLYDNALFLAGRLHGLDQRNADATHIVALCHQRLGQLKLAYDYSRLLALRGSHLGCSYVFAQACFALERHMDGVAALERSRGLWDQKSHWNEHSETSRRHLPDAAAVYCLLGKLLQAQRDNKRAVNCYVEALKLNPFMWDAYERLCETGTKIKPSNIFRANSNMLAVLGPSEINSRENSDEPVQSAHPSYLFPQMNVPQPINGPTNDPFKSTSSMTENGLSAGGSNLLSKLNMAKFPTNSATSAVPSAPIETPPSSNTHDSTVLQRAQGSHVSTQPLEPPNAPSRRTRTIQSSTSESRSELSKPRAMSTRSQTKTSSEDVQEDQPLRQEPTTWQHKRTISGTVPNGASSSSSLLPSEMAAQPTRKSHRIFSQIKPNSNKAPASVASLTSKDPQEVRRLKAIRPKSRTGVASTTSTMNRVASGNRKLVEVSENPTKDVQLGNGDGEVQQSQQSRIAGKSYGQEVMQWLLDLFGKLGQGYYSLCQMQCQEALTVFQSLPIQQRDTPWVLAQIGKAWYEQSRYLDAEKTFSYLRKVVPSRLEDMEVYSTVLWHLKNDTELAFLAHELIEINRLSPQAWCTIGNSFSLQRDHDQALKCFRRATQLDSKFAYGYTLQGHEYIANEEFDKALLAYRKAICADNRHYNGWYGLAKVYEKLGNFDLAEKHYRAAAQINPTNPVLVCCIGSVLEKLKKPLPALHQYNTAVYLAPKSAIARFRKARLLLHLGRHNEALDEFTVLKDMVPDESNVHFMLGRVYKLLGEKGMALRHYTVALNLDPKAAQYIKEAMEALEDEDDDDIDDDDDGMS